MQLQQNQLKNIECTHCREESVMGCCRSPTTKQFPKVVMYQEIHPFCATNSASVKINPPWVMVRKWRISWMIWFVVPPMPRVRIPQICEKAGVAASSLKLLPKNLIDGLKDNQVAGNRWTVAFHFPPFASLSGRSNKGKYLIWWPGKCLILPQRTYKIMFIIRLMFCRNNGFRL